MLLLLPRRALAWSFSLGFLVLLCAEIGHGFLPCLAPPTANQAWTKLDRPSVKLYVSGGDYNLFGSGKKSQANRQQPRGEYDLLGGSTAPASGDDSDDDGPYEVLLADLVFGTEDVREVVYRNLDACDEGFNAFLEKKIEASTDLEERSALRSLVDIIEAVKKAVAKAEAESKALAEDRRRKAEEEELRLAAEIAEARSKAQTREQTQEERSRQKEHLQSAIQGSASSASALEVESGNAAQSYSQLLEAFLGLDYSDDAYVKAVVDANYEKCTIEFLEVLALRLKDPETREDVRAKLTVIQGHIQTIYQERMSRAATRLQMIVKAGPLPAMLERVKEMSQNDEIDEPLVLLLETNLQQAQRAGAGPAIEVFGRLTSAVKEALDEKQDPTKRLIRRLLRTEDSTQRKEMLQDALRPKTPTLRADGSKTDSEPEVSPPALVAELKTLLRNFGNMEELAVKLRLFVEEAEEVSTSIYGKPMTVQEQQDYMWKKASVSVFDLEAMEKKALATGEEIPWANDQYDYDKYNNVVNRPGGRDITGGS